MTYPAAAAHAGAAAGRQPVRGTQPAPNADSTTLAFSDALRTSLRRDPAEITGVVREAGARR